MSENGGLNVSAFISVVPDIGTQALKQLYSVLWEGPYPTDRKKIHGRVEVAEAIRTELESRKRRGEKE